MQTIDLTKIDSINAGQQAGTVTDKYAFIPTMQVVDQFEKNGWLPVHARAVNTRKEDRKGYQKHMIRFRHHKSTPVMDGLHPEIVLTNSHDGASSFQIMAGLFRMICSNGMVVADAQLSTVRIRHQGYTDKAVHEAIEYVGDNAPRILNKVSDFNQIELTDQERMLFGESALLMRYGEQDIQDERFHVNKLIAPVRSKESAPTLWNTYNAVQERFQHGGDYLKDRKRLWRSKRTRKMTSVTEDVRVNQGLWLLAEKMAELKAA